MSNNLSKVNKLQLFLTEDCNLRCDYCYIRKRKSDLPFELAKKTIDLWLETYQPGYQHVIDFFGGEPFLKFDLLQKIVHYANAKSKIYHKPLNFLASTNGTLIDQKFIVFLKKNSNFYINISCDGVQEAHDRHRKTVSGEGSFALLEKSFQRLAENLPHNRAIKVHAVLSPANVFYLHKSYQYFAENYNGAFYFRYNFAYDMEWTEKDFLIFQGQIAAIIESEKNRLLQGNPCLDKIIFTLIRRIIQQDKSHYICQAGRSIGFTVNTEGEMFLCHRFESLLENPRFKAQKEDFWLGNVQDFEKLDWEAWREKKKKIENYLQSNQYEECQNCPNQQYCTWIKCPWNNYAIHQNLSKLNTSICKMLEHFLEPTLAFLEWLQRNNHLNDYMTGFGYGKKPEEEKKEKITFRIPAQILKEIVDSQQSRRLTVEYTDKSGKSGREYFMLKPKGNVVKIVHLPEPENPFLAALQRCREKRK